MCVLPRPYASEYFQNIPSFKMVLLNLIFAPNMKLFASAFKHFVYSHSPTTPHLFIAEGTKTWRIEKWKEPPKNPCVPNVIVEIDPKGSVAFVC